MYGSLPLLYLLTLTIGALGAKIDESKFPASKVVTRDVVIIGGGASGTYAAVRLREDFDTSIVVIEHQARLGGHVETYTVPETNTTIEYGVQSYMRQGRAVEFFERFGIEIVPFSARRLTTINVDVRSGKMLSSYIPPSNNATNAAFEIWQEWVQNFAPLVEPGLWNFPSPEDIPAELLVTFEKFAQTHDIAAAAPRIAAISDMGTGGIGDLLMLNMVLGFGPSITNALLDGSLFSPVGSNSLLYQHAYDLLKDDVYLESSIKQTERSKSGVRIVINTPDGEVLIKAKRALWTANPSHNKNLKPFDEDRKEAEVFKNWVQHDSYVGVMSIPCIPENHSLSYVAPAASPSNYIAVRDYNYTLRFDSTGASGLNLFRVLFSTNYSITMDEAKETILHNIQKVVAAGTLNVKGSCKADFKAFASHTGVSWAEKEKLSELRDGFVQRLYALQGYRSTWWTGRSWTGYYSSNVWSFTDTVLEKMLGGLKE